MTRELHSETEVQRGDSDAQVSPEERERGYEASDAPAGRVALGAASLFGLLVVGLVSGGLLVLYLRDHSEEPVPPFADIRLVPPTPRLLESMAPPLDRLRRPQTSTPSSSPAIEAAMEQVQQQGWRDDLPAPPAEDVARDHARAAR